MRSLKIPQWVLDQENKARSREFKPRRPVGYVEALDGPCQGQKLKGSVVFIGFIKIAEVRNNQTVGWHTYKWDYQRQGYKYRGDLDAVVRSE